ncbi:unnamed protein product [Albugo candida]|uniref:Uncharacterized protein n=1 Tax=Albugo candida TaxID=65357 RepID=A0A024FTZ1_9STRA|nr:unnamed protein product [Albugo candida]|eukprot:CCI10402.1 unnamed protein product [Albugo candida]
MATTFHKQTAEMPFVPPSHHYSNAPRITNELLHRKAGRPDSTLENLDFTAPLPKTPAPPLSPPLPRTNPKVVMNRSSHIMVAKYRVRGNLPYPRAPSSPHLGMKQNVEFDISSVRNYHGGSTSPIHSPPMQALYHQHHTIHTSPIGSTSSPSSYSFSAVQATKGYSQQYLISQRPEVCGTMFPEVLLVSPGEPTPTQLSNYDNKQPTGFLHVTDGNQTVEFLVGVANMPTKA